MKSIPWLIIVIGICHILEPIPKVFIYAHLNGLTVQAFLVSAFNNASTYDLIAFFLFFPLAGVAILSVRKWSYAVILSVVTLSTWSNVQIWTDPGSGFSWALFGAIVVLNVIVVTYFVLPQVSVVYFNPRLRWWQMQPRYCLNILGEVFVNGETKPCQMVNFSFGGALFRSVVDLEVDIIDLEFDLNDNKYRFSGKIVHANKAGKRVYGIRFDGLTDEQKGKARELCRYFEAESYRKTLEIPSWMAIVSDGVRKLLKTGQGVLPEVEPVLREQFKGKKTSEKAA